MKARNIILGTILIAAVSVSSAQEKIEETTNGVEIEKKITSETTEKTYTVKKGDEVIKNSVKINTEATLEMMWEEEDKGKVDQDRVIPKKKITKTVLIDSDKDDSYDEKIVFSYMGDKESDFTLVTNNDELLVAIDQGDDLKIIDAQNISLGNIENKETYVFTDENGAKVEFFVESYTKLENQ